MESAELEMPVERQAANGSESCRRRCLWWPSLARLGGQVGHGLTCVFGAAEAALEFDNVYKMLRVRRH